MEIRNPGGQGGSTLEEASMRAGAAGERISERARSAMDQVTGRVQDMTERLSERGEEWMAHSDEMLDSVRQYVREKPMMAIAIAAGVGFLLSRMLR
jgi:ElaB/YqjD/DUF883 family membrane-anchored ribosome-binding protein